MSATNGRRVLLANDDGIASPALRPFARALRRLGDVVAVVPDRERSWGGKALTRIGDVGFTRVVEEDDLEIWVTDGTPADAAQLGLRHLEHDPDLVVAGINLGFNHGAGFLMSSGTVGAAVEGWIAGLPALAFSTGTVTEPWDHWTAQAWDDASHGRWELLAELCVDVVEVTLAEGLVDIADVVNVNVPWDADEGTDWRVTTVARVGYEPLLRRRDDGRFEHDFRDVLVFDALDGTDSDALDEDVVSISPLRMPDTIGISDDLRGRIERRSHDIGRGAS